MITNKYGLPEAFVNFAKLDKYSKGNADISVTQLIDSPRVLLMREEHKDKRETPSTCTPQRRLSGPMPFTCLTKYPELDRNRSRAAIYF